MASKAEIERVIAQARGVEDNPFNLGTRGYWAFQDSMFGRFIAARPRRLHELRGLMASTGGTELDGSPESLGPLGEWLAVPVMAGGNWNDGLDWLPVWTRISGNERPSPGGLGLAEYYRLLEMVGFYFADVVISQLPGSKWVCWRRERFNFSRTGEFLVDMGTFPVPSAPLDAVGNSLASIFRTLLDHSDPDYEASRERTLRSEFDRQVSYRLEWEAEGRPLDFQAAPTRDGAGVNRGPYKGSRIKAKIDQRRGYG
ncbi:MAG: hypothetical protein LBC97_12820 [Bifidobacteriaceae bacterium]|jgi:hypothetical protein|nr:hypothetical protein [Bifidobacteriaceae bacterium]